MSNQPSEIIISDSKKPFAPNAIAFGFFIPAHLLGIILWPLYLCLGGTIQWQEVSILLFMWILSTIGINFGYHRCFSHLSFKMSPILKFITLVGGGAAAEGSVLAWVSDHRRHHRYQDTERDPYNIKRGFWWAHMGWILGAPTTNDFSNVKDLAKDPLIANQDKYYVGWLAFNSYGLPLLLGILLGRPIEALLLAGAFRLVFFNHVTYLINSYAHYFGRRPYSRKVTARDSFIAAILTSGEGWHNYHHRFPWDYRNGVRFYHYDITKWFIQLTHLCGLTWDLKKAPASEIYKARIETQKEKAISRSPSSEAVERALAKWNQVSSQWAQMKEQLKAKKEALQLEFSEAYAEQLNELSEQIKELKTNAKEAKIQFKIQYSIWKASLRSLPAH